MGLKEAEQGFPCVSAAVCETENSRVVLDSQVSPDSDCILYMCPHTHKHYFSLFWCDWGRTETKREPPHCVSWFYIAVMKGSLWSTQFLINLGASFSSAGQQGEKHFEASGISYRGHRAEEVLGNLHVFWSCWEEGNSSPSCSEATGSKELTIRRLWEPLHNLPTDHLWLNSWGGRRLPWCLGVCLLWWWDASC